MSRDTWIPLVLEGGGGGARCRGYAQPAAPRGWLKLLQTPQLAFGARAAQCQPSASAVPLEVIMGGGFRMQWWHQPHRFHPTFSEV